MVLLSMLAVLLPRAATPSLTTVAEQSGFQRTGRYAEVESLCSAFARRYPGKVRCERFGTTPLGRPMLALVASADGTLEPGRIAQRKRPVLYLQGGIHAGEIDGKDAGFLFLRQLLDGQVLPGALAKATVLFVPVLNVDGHERFGRNHRPNQNGPEETGWRVGAHNLNLNRDHAKAEAPEMAALLRLLGRYDPILYADLHVTDGAKFQHDISLTLEPWAQGPKRLRALGQRLKDGVLEELRHTGHLPVPFYPELQEHDDPTTGFAYHVPPPRFGSTYWSARNRFGVLVEIHSWKDYPTRVRATFDTLVALLRRTVAEGGEWLAAAEEADAADRAAGSAGPDVVLAWKNPPSTRRIQFLGYAYTRELSAVSGKLWTRYDDSKPLVWDVPYVDQVVAELSVRAPRGGYLVPPEHAGWVRQKLKLHGFEAEVLDRPVTAEVEVFRAAEVKLSPDSYEGRQRARLLGAWGMEARPLGKGTLYVPTGQPGARLLVMLMDPLGPDSFAAWGFFNAHFERKEYMEDYVTEAVARQLLEDPKVKAEFEARLKDPAFAKDPDARLLFFYRRHPSFDERYNLYPVFRTDRPPSGLR